MTTLTAAEADALIPGEWFGGYCKQVELVENARTLDDLRTDDAIYVLYNNGLTATGTIDLRDTRSIIVVRGTLRAKRVILGDAVLVVTERVIADEIVGASNEGLFEVGGHQVEGDQDGLLAALETRLVAILNRSTCAYVIRDGDRMRSFADLVPELRDEDKRHEVNERGLIDSILAGRPIFGP